MSGIAVSGDLAITMWNSDAGQAVSALDLKSGRTVWSTTIAPIYENGMGDGPRATPTISGDRVYAYSGEGVLACLNLADGNIVWKKNVVGELGGKPAEYGMSCSPLVVKDLVVTSAAKLRIDSLKRQLV